jgi:ACS family sodium-dependent inorganic phosphate cotransporter-like MFS transporter 5
VPLHERSRLIGLTFSGIQLGNLIATLIGGIFCSLDNDDGNNSFLNIFPGWSLNFYFFGILGLIWTCAFYLLGSDTPEKNKFVRRGEREYLSAYLVKPITDNKTTKTTTPWSKILTSRIVITLNLCCLCYNWGLYLYLTQIPSYVRDVLKFDVKSVSY